MQSDFFALMARMKYIHRWALMRNAHEENLSEHSMDVAMTAHALVLLHNLHSEEQLSAERAAVLALFHDAPEILTGDMPTPVKYYNTQVRDAYKSVEESACRTILDLLPEQLREAYVPLFLPQEADAPLTLAVILAVPAFLAVIFPKELTVATLELLLFQVGMLPSEQTAMTEHSSPIFNSL